MARDAQAHPAQHARQAKDSASFTRPHHSDICFMTSAMRHTVCAIIPPRFAIPTITTPFLQMPPVLCYPPSHIIHAATPPSLSDRRPAVFPVARY